MSQKMNDLTQKTDVELAALLADSRKQVVQLAIDMRTKQVANVKQMHGLKRTIARVLTLQRERDLVKLAQAQTQAPEAAKEKEANHG